MAWELAKVEDQRKQLVEAYIDGSVTMTVLCKKFRISRKTGYKWYQRYLEHGTKGLSDLPKAPRSPHVIYDEDFVTKIIDLKLKHRTWGPKKILAKLKHNFPEMHWPSATRMYEILKDHHLVTPRRIRKRVSATHPLGELNQSNDVWIADFKGWFLTKNKDKCEPLTITDGYSRFLIKCEHLSRKGFEYVWSIYREAFHEYGLPKRIRTDNGPPFGSIGIGRLTRLSINLIKAGIVPEWINPGHPEENGRHERFHLTLKQTVANPPAYSLREQIKRLKKFQDEYNFERPHEALGMKTPSTHYSDSSREWDGILRSPEYDTKDTIVRKVCKSGCFWFKQKEYFLGQLLTGEYIGMTEEDDSNLNIYYGPVFLGKLSVGVGIERPKLKKKAIIRRG